MNAYAPTHAAAVFVVVAWLAATAGFGPLVVGLPARAARTLAWTVLVLAVATVHVALRAEPPGVRMLALIAVALAGMKAVVVAQRHADGRPDLSWKQWLRFGFAWLGMEPACFTVARQPQGRQGRALIGSGLAHMVLGSFVLALAASCAANEHSHARVALALVGTSLVLHFGFCAVLVGAWRWRGVPVGPLFRTPTQSTSLAEFWGRRWNVGFSQMTRAAVYRPLAVRFGRSAGLLGAFAFSGVLHEMAISLPVHAGYGGPLAYFVVQAALVGLERRARANGHSLSGWSGRAWTLAAVCLPLPLLFHAPFVHGVLLPLIFHP